MSADPVASAVSNSMDEENNVSSTTSRKDEVEDEVFHAGEEVEEEVVDGHAPVEEEHVAVELVSVSRTPAVTLAPAISAIGLAQSVSYTQSMHVDLHHVADQDDPFFANERQALEAVMSLRQKAQAWADMDIADKVKLLDETREAFSEVRHQWAKDLALERGYEVIGEPGPGEVLTGSGAHAYEEQLNELTLVVERTLFMVREHLHYMASHTVRGHFSAKYPYHMIARENGQMVCTVFPCDGDEDALLLPQVDGYVWLDPGSHIEQAHNFREGATPGLAVVIGPHAVGLGGVCEVLNKLFIENQVVLFKHGSLFASSSPHFQAAFEPLIKAKFLQHLTCDKQTVHSLVSHDDVTSLHFMGGIYTFMQLAWGETSEEQEQRIADKIPALAPDKAVSAELGAVAPVIVVPTDEWSDEDLDHYAAHLVYSIVQNTGANASAPQLVVLPKNWPNSEKFVDRIRAQLANTRGPMPAMHDLHLVMEELTGLYPHIEKFPVRPFDAPGKAKPEASVQANGADQQGVVTYVDSDHEEDGPCWLLVDDVSLDDDDFITVEHAYYPILGVAYIDPADGASRSSSNKGTAQDNDEEPDSVADFLRAAVSACNVDVYGTLCCSIFIHPSTKTQYAQELETAIADLEFGAVVINAEPRLAYLIPTCAWGAYTGATLDNPVSGLGTKTRNSFFFDRPNKSVVHAGFANPISVRRQDRRQYAYHREFNRRIDMLTHASEITCGMKCGLCCLRSCTKRDKPEGGSRCVVS